MINEIPVDYVILQDNLYVDIAKILSIIKPLEDQINIDKLKMIT